MRDSKEQCRGNMRERVYQWWSMEEERASVAPGDYRNQRLYSTGRHSDEPSVQPGDRPSGYLQEPADSSQNTCSFTTQHNARAQHSNLTLQHTSDICLRQIFHDIRSVFTVTDKVWIQRYKYKHKGTGYWDYSATDTICSVSASFQYWYNTQPFNTHTPTYWYKSTFYQSWQSTIWSMAKTITLASCNE